MKNKKSTKVFIILNDLRKTLKLEVNLYGNNSPILEIQVRRKIHE